MQDKLRKEAEKIIRKLRNVEAIDTQEFDKVVHELQVHQIELELQNEELQRTSNELEKSRRRFSDLFEHAPVGYMLFDEDFRILHVNYSATFMLNCEKSKLEGKKITQFIHPDFQDAFYLHANSVLSTENLHTEEIRFKKSATQYFNAQIQSVKDIEPDTRKGRIRMAIMDISERKAIEKDLKRFRAAIDSSADNIFLINLATNRFIDVNESACRKLGFSRKEFLCMKPEHINPKYTHNFIKSLLIGEKGNLIRESLNMETRHTLKEGQVIDVEVFLKYIPIEDEEVVVAVARDITERKKIQEKLSEYAQELKELNASKDKFLSIISHDLRGPFLGIKGYTQMLIEDYDMMGREEIMDYLNNIHESTRDLYTLVDNLLKWSRLELGKMPYEPMSFNLATELEPLLKLLSGVAAKKEIKIENAIRKDIAPFGDRLMVVSVVQNLVSNAIKFTRKGGKVKLKAQAANGKVTICVEDNGIGIRPEVMEKLFTLDKSHTSKGTAGEKGTGFGLLIAKEMVSKMGGEIWVQSEPDKGSVFFFTLSHQS